MIYKERLKTGAVHLDFAKCYLANLDTAIRKKFLMQNEFNRSGNKLLLIICLKVSIS